MEKLVSKTEPLNLGKSLIWFDHNIFATDGENQIQHLKLCIWILEIEWMARNESGFEKHFLGLHAEMKKT